MTLDRSHCPFSSPKDRKSAVYYGHLLAKAEQMSGLKDRTDHLALIWLAAIAWTEKSRLWRVSLSGLNENGIDHGDWRITVRSETTQSDPVGIHRREFLAEEGIQILALASPFLPVKVETSNTDIVETGRRNLAEASSMRLILSTSKSTPKSGGRFEISDLHGNHATVSLEKKGFMSKFKPLFSS